MELLLKEIRKCEHCRAHLPLGPNPVLRAGPDARIAIIGQAPGSRVHQSGIPWDDLSGRQLREWLGISEEVFYDSSRIALIPMGFCYPGKGKSGDLAPRPECAPMWHSLLLKRMSRLRLTLLIGSYAQNYYLGEAAKKTLTETVRAYSDYLPEHFPLPHPSPRNRFWLSKNPWYDKKILPELRSNVIELLKSD